jgi:hypothetical protein
MMRHVLPLIALAFALFSLGFAIYSVRVSRKTVEAAEANLRMLEQRARRAN